MSNNTSTDQAASKTETNLVTPILIISFTFVGIILIAVLTYIWKIKQKNKSHNEKNRMKTIFKKTYIDYKPDQSSFSLKISNFVSELNVSNSVVGKPSKKSSAKSIKIINFKNLCLKPLANIKVAEETQNNIHSTSNRNKEPGFKKTTQISGNESVMSTNLINVLLKKDQIIA
jgi:hypothetical protein